MTADSLLHLGNALRENIRFLKDTESIDQLFSKSISMAGRSGFSIPVCRYHLADEDFIDKLQKFTFYCNDLSKSDYQDKFAWFEKEIIDNETVVFFIVTDRRGQYINLCGLKITFTNNFNIEFLIPLNSYEDDLFSLALESILDWARQFMPDRIFVSIKKDNTRLINYLENNSFFISGLLSDGAKTVRIYHNKEDELIHMVYGPKKCFQVSEMILTAGPSISGREVSYTLDAVRYGWNNEWNKYIKKFEKTFADYLGVKYAISTSSCTGALHLALAALGIGPGDEVIVPDITWVATANAVLYVGATPIFADIEADSWCLDPKSFESLITERTKAVMPVHLYGHPAKMDEIVSIARKHNLYIVEDAAPAIGAMCFGQKAGTFGDFAAFSFQGAKVAVTGEGGMIVTNNDDFYQKVYTIWDQGRVPGTFWIAHNGLKYKMSNVQAAIGLGQIERIDELIEAKRRIFRWYEDGLKEVPHIKLNKELNWARSIYWMTSVLISKDAPMTRDEFRDKLKERKIDTRSVFPAISQYPIWPKAQGSQPTASFVGELALNLPSGVCLKHEQVDYISDCIKKIMNKES